MEILAVAKADPDILSSDAGIALVKFVEALAIRQARIDAGVYFEAANDNQPRTLH